MGGRGTQQVLNKSALPCPGPVQRAHCPFQAHALEPDCPVLTLALLSCTVLGRLLTFCASFSHLYNKSSIKIHVKCLAHSKHSISLSSSYCCCYSPAWQKVESLCRRGTLEQKLGGEPWQGGNPSGSCPVSEQQGAEWGAQQAEPRQSWSLMGGGRAGKCCPAFWDSRERREEREALWEPP